MQCYTTLKPDVKKEFINLIIQLNIVAIIFIFRLILLCMRDILDLKDTDVKILFVPCFTGAIHIIFLIHSLLHLDNKFTIEMASNKYEFMILIWVIEFSLALVSVIIENSKSLLIIYYYIVLALTLLPIAYYIIKYVIILPIIYTRNYIIESRKYVNNEKETTTPS